MTEEMLSVGIDIGTTTTQVVFSTLKLENTASFSSVPKVSIVDKQIVYKGDILFTPFRTELMIDIDELYQIVSKNFQKAGFSPKDIDTGVVIITGEAARKENAAAVLQGLTQFAGEFVISAAGPDLEAILAGKGSGAQVYSGKNGCTVANLDIGGGTTNIVVFDSGEVLAKGCLDIGGRLIRLDKENTVEYISPSVALIADSSGFHLKIGQKADVQLLRAITDRMNDLLEQELGFAQRDDFLDRFRTPGSSPFFIDKRPDYICFSGGIAEYIYNDADRPFLFGDIGVLLGRSVSNGKLVKEAKVIFGAEPIRATAIGVGAYAIAVSGSTITVTRDVFPLKNVPVLSIGSSQEKAGLLQDAVKLKEEIKWFRTQSGNEEFVLAFKGEKNASYSSIEGQALCIAGALSRTLPLTYPSIIAVESDISKVLGQTLRRFSEKDRDIICIDGVSVSEGDYIDMGKPIMDGLVVPLVIKTLVFG